MTRLARGPLAIGVRGRLILDGPWQIGTGERLALTDAPVLLDSTGRPYLPGTSIRGVLRDFMEREAHFYGASQDEIEHLFGTVRQDVDRQGRLTFFDAHAEGTPITRIRDHVRIDPRWGAAAHGGKFDIEVAGRGVFRLCVLYEGGERGDTRLDALAVALLGDAISAFQRGRITVGGRAAWGHGRARLEDVEWTQRDCKDPQQFAHYLTARLRDRQPAEMGVTRPIAPAQRVLADSLTTGRPPWNYAEVVLRLQFDGPMLVQGTAAQTSQSLNRVPDHEPFVDEAGRYAIPGSGLRGVLRHELTQVDRQNGTNAVDVVFGTTKGAGLLRVDDAKHVRGVRINLDHVAIDRITGFAADHKLFCTEALMSPCFESKLRLRWASEQCSSAGTHRDAIKSFLFVLRDLIDGWLWVGGMTTRGYGHVKRASIKEISCSVVRGHERQERSVAGAALSLEQIQEYLDVGTE